MIVRAAASAALLVLLPQGLQPLPLRVGVDIGTDHETNNVEEGHPGLLRQELLGNGQRNGRSDPADLHDRHETGTDSCAHLMEGASASNDGHCNKVNGILDGCHLRQS